MRADPMPQLNGRDAAHAIENRGMSQQRFSLNPEILRYY